MPKKMIAVSVAVLLAATLSACQHSTPKNDAQKTGQKLTEQAFGQQQAAEPYPVSLLRDSTERANLIRHLLRFNDPNKIGYVYIVNFGKVVGYYVIKGKVSSTDSQLTTSTLIIHDGYPNGGSAVPVTAPGDDGSYGPNEPGVFFFTTGNVMVETSLDYLYSDQPLPIDVPLLGGDKNASESPADLSAALENECKAVGKAAGITTAAGQTCTQAEIQKIAPQR